MMGRTIASLDEPVIKATNGLVAMSQADSVILEPTACLHCGKCVEACPLDLNPVAYSDALDIDDEDKRELILKKEDVPQCMECGCCAYVCPAHRPLVANNRAAKKFLRGRRK